MLSLAHWQTHAQMSGGHMGFADRGIVPRAISAIYSEAIKSVLIKSGILSWFCFLSCNSIDSTKRRWFGDRFFWLQSRRNQLTPNCKLTSKNLQINQQITGLNEIRSFQLASWRLLHGQRITSRLSYRTCSPQRWYVKPASEPANMVKHSFLFTSSKDFLSS